jgi:RNA polymerase primary sigma factor
MLREEVLAFSGMGEFQRSLLESSPGEALTTRELYGVMEKLLRTLTPREELILLQVFWDKQRLEDIGREHGVSRSRIGQIKASALAKLRHPRRANFLRPFIEPRSHDARRKLSLEQWVVVGWRGGGRA